MLREGRLHRGQACKLQLRASALGKGELDSPLRFLLTMLVLLELDQKSAPALAVERGIHQRSLHGSNRLERLFPVADGRVGRTRRRPGSVEHVQQRAGPHSFGDGKRQRDVIASTFLEQAAG